MNKREKKKKKRYLTIIMSGIMVLCLPSCGKTNLETVVSAMAERTAVLPNAEGTFVQEVIAEDTENHQSKGFVSAYADDPVINQNYVLYDDSLKIPLGRTGEELVSDGLFSPQMMDVEYKPGSLGVMDVIIRNACYLGLKEGSSDTLRDAYTASIEVYHDGPEEGEKITFPGGVMISMTVDEARNVLGAEEDFKEYREYAYNIGNHPTEEYHWGLYDFGDGYSYKGKLRIYADRDTREILRISYFYSAPSGSTYPYREFETENVDITTIEYDDSKGTPVFVTQSCSMVIYTVTDRDEYGQEGFVLKVTYENLSDKVLEFMVYSDKYPRVNGTRVGDGGTWWSVLMSPHSVAEKELVWTKKELENKGISEVKTLEIQMHVQEGSGAHNVYVDDVFKIDFP